MTTYSSDEDGLIVPSELDFLERRAQAGFGMVMTAACYVHKSGHAFPGQWRCYHDDCIEPSLRPAAKVIQAHGSAAVLQIHHGGRQSPSRLCGQPVSASAVPSERPNAETPKEMSQGEIDEIVQAFADGARRAKEAGYDGVEIHGANTYLLQQFVSPHSNRRTDAYGQDPFLFSCQVTEAVIEAVGPDFPIGYRFSPEEMETPGIRLDRTLQLLDRLCAYPLAWLHISLGKFSQGSIVGDYEDATLTRVHRHLAGRVPLIGVGSVKTHEDARACLETGCELVAVGRAAITEPDWPKTNTPRLKFPRTGAAETCVLPEGLVNRILGAPGWFEMDETDPVSA